MKIETLWDDWTEIEANEAELDVRDEGQQVFLEVAKSTTQNPFPIHLKVPEHSGIKIKTASGSIEHINTPTIDGKLKGDVHITHSGTSSADHIKLRSLQSEDCQIDMFHANLTFKSGLQVKQGHVRKTQQGEVNFSMLGVAERFQVDLENCNLNCKSVYTNPVDATWGSEKSYPCFELKLRDAKGQIGVVKGSVSAKLMGSAELKISSAQFDHLSLSMDSGTNCSLFISSLPTQNPIIEAASGSKLKITCPQDLTASVSNLFTGPKIKGSVELSVCENKENLVGYFVGRSKATPRV